MKYSLLNSNTSRLSTSSVMSQMLKMVKVGIEFYDKALRRLAFPSSCDMLRASTSMGHNIELTERGHRAYSLSRKSCVSRMYDRMLGTKGGIK